MMFHVLLGFITLTATIWILVALFKLESYRRNDEFGLNVVGENESLWNEIDQISSTINSCLSSTSFNSAQIKEDFLAMRKVQVVIR